MNFELTEEQIAVRDAARDFAQNVLKPAVIERDREQKFPAEEVKQLGELGFLGIFNVFPCYSLAFPGTSKQFPDPGRNLHIS